MTPASRLAALAGTWRTRRVLRHADGTWARFEGKSVWSPDGALLRCVEAGRLSQGGQGFSARRETLWRASPGGIEVLFADGRPFHCITDDAWARHDCPPDLYWLRYDFRAWPRWAVRWRVTGPRKAYRALTRYDRPAIS